MSGISVNVELGSSSVILGDESLLKTDLSCWLRISALSEDLNAISHFGLEVIRLCCLSGIVSYKSNISAHPCFY